MCGYPLAYFGSLSPLPDIRSDFLLPPDFVQNYVNKGKCYAAPPPGSNFAAQYFMTFPSLSNKRLFTQLFRKNEFKSISLVTTACLQ